MILADFLGIKTAINSLFITLDTVIYYFVSLCYRLFLMLATINIFDVDQYDALVRRIYIILGVVMLFILSYSLLKAIVDPDGSEKGDDAPAKIVGKTVTSLVLVLIMPVIFEYAYGFQVAILESNALGKIILGSPSTGAVGSEYDKTLTSMGSEFSLIVYGTFFRPNEMYCAEAASKENSTQFDDIDAYKDFMDVCADKHINSSEPIPSHYSRLTPELRSSDEISLADAHYIAYRGNFGIYSFFAKNVTNGQISHMFPLSLIAGAFLCYVMVSFCFDLGIRVAKLAFLQIIAPIPIFARIMPGSAKDIFNNWVKKTTAVFVEVFVRVVIMFFGVYLIRMFSVRMWDIVTKEMIGEGPFILVTLAIAFVIMGIVAFIKQAPKLIGEIFPGMNSDGMSLGIMDKLAAGGGLTAAAGIGGLATTALRGFSKSRAQGKNLARSLFGGGLGGALSGGRRALWQGRNAKNWADTKEATKKGIQNAVDARSTKESYRANPELRGELLARKMRDFYHGPVDMERLEKKKQIFDEIAGSVNRLRDAATSEDHVIETLKKQMEEMRKKGVTPTIEIFNETEYEEARNNARIATEQRVQSELSTLSQDLILNKINKEEFETRKGQIEANRNQLIETAVNSVSKGDYTTVRNKTAEEIEAEVVELEKEIKNLDNQMKTRSGKITNAVARADVDTLVKDYNFTRDKAETVVAQFQNAVATENAIISDARLQFGELRDNNVHEYDLNSADFAKTLKDQNDVMKDTVVPGAEREMAEARRTKL